MRRRQSGESKISTVVGLAAASGGSSGLSFFVDTLPMLQWAAVLVGIISGVLAIVLSIKKLNK